MSDRHATRRQKLLKIVRQNELDGMLITGVANVSWLTGFSGDSSWLLLTPNVCVLISDSRYETQIAEECPGLESVIRVTPQSIVEATARVINKVKPASLGFEGQSLSFDTVEEIAAALKSTTLVSLPGEVEMLRAVKDAGEIAEIREAVRLASRGFDFLRATLTPDMTELNAAHELEHAMRRFGAEGVSFPPIVAVDDRAALAHYHPGQRVIGEAKMLLVDWGAETAARYKSDLTRMLVFGKPTKKLTKVYDTVLKANERAIRAIKPGVTCKEIDAQARGYIEQAGYGRRFGHGLGHGIGLEIHELPRFAPNSETILEPGMVVTVEPGIYLPDWGGVRIEDDVLVTAEGCEVLSAKVPKDFESTLME
jgi:Xaa-Pro aminopeptidase